MRPAWQFGGDDRRQRLKRELLLCRDNIDRLSVSDNDNQPARRLYEGIGYLDAGVAPVRVLGAITLRGRTVEVDDTLAYLAKSL